MPKIVLVADLFRGDCGSDEKDTDQRKRRTPQRREEKENFTLVDQRLVA